MKKKISIRSLLTLLFLTVLLIPINASAVEKPKSYYEFILEGVEAYYRNKDLGEKNNLSNYFSEDVLTLLNAKIEMDTFQRQTYDLEYKDYQITILPFNQSNWVDDGNNVYVNIQVERVWYYSSEPTIMSEVLEVSISKDTNESWIIIGCYNMYESITYGPIDEVFQSAQLAKKTSTLEDLLDEYIIDFKEQCIKKNVQMKVDEQSCYNIEKNIEPMSLTYLTRSAIREWARNNYNQNSPTSSKSSVPYYDFSQISGAYDCTNFVSHALLAGGATMHDDGSSGIQGTDQWYYRSTANRSSSWAGVNQLYIFLTRSNPSNSNKGPYATEKSLTYANAYLGDIVQGNNGTIWRHSTVVTGFNNYNILVTGRTAPGQYNDNQLATTIYGEQRLLHIEGNYTG